MAARDTAGPDGDGFTDLKEYLFGIIPTAPSVGALFTATPATANLAHSFVAKQAAGPGYTGLTRHYAVETTTDLTNPLSSTSLAGWADSIGANQPSTVTQPTSGGKGFYLLSVEKLVGVKRPRYFPGSGAGVRR